MSENREIMIQIKDLKKRYKLGTIGGGTLTADLQSWWARVRHKEDPNSKIGTQIYGKNEAFMALDGINLTVHKGERLGVIGHNGAGKSTLLKLLSRVTGPTQGEIRLNGRISSMLEVGTGFNPELTGRENIYLNGAVLGFSKKFMDEHFQEIVDFSELHNFLDVPLKNYSSGMVARIAFAIATVTDPDILIADEVLAVGDYTFQQKCEKRMKQLIDNGTTVLFVSHSIEQVKALCNKATWLEHGKVVMTGDAESVCNEYIKRY